MNSYVRERYLKLTEIQVWIFAIVRYWAIVWIRNLLLNFHIDGYYFITNTDKSKKSKKLMKWVFIKKFAENLAKVDYSRIWWFKLKLLYIWYDYISVKRHLVELFELIQTAMPVVEDLIKVNQIHCYLLYEFMVKLILVFLYLYLG